MSNIHISAIHWLAKLLKNLKALFLVVIKDGRGIRIFNISREKISWTYYSHGRGDWSTLVNCRLCKAKFPTFEWPFSRTLNKSRMTRFTPRDAQFCQVLFSYRTFFGARARSLLISTFLRSDRKLFTCVIWSTFLSPLKRLRVSRDGDLTPRKVQYEKWTWQNWASFGVGLAFLALLKVLEKGPSKVVKFA